MSDAKDHRAIVAFGAADLLGAVRVAFKDGPAGALMRLEDALRNGVADGWVQGLVGQLESLVKEGRARPETLKSPEQTTALAEVAQDLRENPPDVRRLEMIRRAFLGVAVKSGDGDSSLHLAFLGTARRLSGLQATIVGQAWRLSKALGPSDPHDSGSKSRHQRKWYDSFKRLMCIPHDVLLDAEMKALYGLQLVRGEKLLGSIHGARGSPFTDYGEAFCEFLEAAEPFEPLGDEGVEQAS